MNVFSAVFESVTEIMFTHFTVNTLISRFLSISFLLKMSKWLSRLLLKQRVGNITVSLHFSTVDCVGVLNKNPPSVNVNFNKSLD